eukprot:763496-Hanusia_phi.AAC.1
MIPAILSWPPPVSDRYFRYIMTRDPNREVGVDERNGAFEKSTLQNPLLNSVRYCPTRIRGFCTMLPKCRGMRGQLRHGGGEARGMRAERRGQERRQRAWGTMGQRWKTFSASDGPKSEWFGIQLGTGKGLERCITHFSLLLRTRPFESKALIKVEMEC